MTTEEIRKFYNTPLEPERQVRLARFVRAGSAMQGDSANAALVAEFMAARRSLQEINVAMQEDYAIRKLQKAAMERTEELRGQMFQEGGQ